MKFDAEPGRKGESTLLAKESTIHQSTERATTTSETRKSASQRLKRRRIRSDYKRTDDVHQNGENELGNAGQSDIALFKKYDATKSIEDMKKEPRPQILVQLHYRFLDNIMTENNDFTSRQLHSALVSEYSELCGISVSTVKRARNRLGWISKKT